MKLLILSMSLMLNASLFAQEGQNHPCAEDVKKFCTGVEKGQGRIVKCLKEHESNLAPACTSKMLAGKEKIRAKAKDIYANCKEDIQKLCKETAKGKGGKMKCLEDKKDQVSDKCKAALPEHK